MRQEKSLLIEEIQENVSRFGNSFVIASYNKLTANQANAFRREIQKAGGGFSAVKKRVLHKAAESIEVDLNGTNLEGHIGLVFTGEDPVATTKALKTFSKENNDTIMILGGKIEGEMLEPQQVEAFASLPSKDVMRAQLIATLEAPMSQTVAVMNALLTSVVYCLENKSQQSS